MIPREKFGYYISRYSEKPDYDPGTDMECLLCNKPLSEPMKTISFMRPGSFKSYFWRAHKDCYENADSDQIGEIEGTIIDDEERI